MTGWLVSQLPEAMQRQELLVAFARAGEEIADTVRSQIHSLDAQIDSNTATDPMLGYLASWFGYSFDASLDADLLRRFLKEVGRILRRRGTRTALTTLLEVLTGGTAEVTDPGGVVGPSESLAQDVRRVTVRLSQPGPLGLERLTAIASREVPVGVELVLTVGEAAA